MVYIRGHYLEYALPIIETERTVIIAEADRPTSELLMAHNQTASENGIVPMVTSIEVKPDLQTRIDQVLATKPTQGDQYGFEDSGYPDGR